MLPSERIREVFGKDAAFARAVVNELAIRYRGIVRALKNEKLRNSAARLANWILLSDQQQGGTGKVTLSFDKRTLASQLGMTPENLSRNFMQLGKHGIRNDGRDIIIEDRSALMAFAQPSSLIDG
jgi:CRP/FNR family transcriptional activator FtrB